MRLYRRATIPVTFACVAAKQTPAALDSALPSNMWTAQALKSRSIFQVRKARESGVGPTTILRAGPLLTAASIYSSGSPDPMDYRVVPSKSDDHPRSPARSKLFPFKDRVWSFAPYDVTVPGSSHSRIAQFRIISNSAFWVAHLYGALIELP